jgi:sensor histidine kinase YesM
MSASRTTTGPNCTEIDTAVAQTMTRHPLEMIPVFRRWKRGFFRDVVYTAIWNTALALIFTAFMLAFNLRIPLARMLMVNLVFAHCVGYAIQFLFAIAFRVVPVATNASFTFRAIYFFVIPLVGVYLGYWLASTLLAWGDMQTMLLTVRGALNIALLSLVLSGIMFAILLPRERAARAQLRIAQEEARVAAAERETAIARMQLLEAQVEPHFLYNTMAHVVSLIDTDATAAKGMLVRLIALLRSTAAAANGGGTLQAQIDHLNAYLDILAMRMGPRLAWAIDVAPDLADLPLPPMLLQPVVENAIKHGLEPKVEGGRIAIAARRDGDRLVLTVTDTGLGFSARRTGDSTGLGLANLRARLAAVYGAKAGLTIEDNPPAGARVTIALPLPVAPQ